MAWITPKTDWVITDRFNISDYNRIKNNIQWLVDKADELLIVPVGAYDMGDDVVDYTGYRTADEFNAFEQNVDILNHAICYRDYGGTITFYPNGKFIQYTELNRLENACEKMKPLIEGLEDAIADKRLSFTLGQYKSIRL